MRALCCVLAVGLASGGLAGGAMAAPEEEHHAPEATSLASPIVEVPMDLTSGRPIVQVRINGHGPYDFIFDTGASSTLVDASIAQELGLPVAGESAVGDPRNPEAITVDLVRADSVTVGGLRLSGVTLATFDVRKMMGPRYGGVLGLPDLAGVLVSLDYPQGRLTLSRGELAGDDPRVVGYDPSGYIIALPMKVSGRTVNAHLDSGNPGSFSLPRALGDSLAFKSAPVEVGRASTVNTSSAIWAAQLDGEIEVAGVAFRDPEVSLTDLLAEWANIGFDALKDLTVTIDQAHHRLRLERTGTGERRLPARRRLGVAFAGMRPAAEGLPLTDGGLAVNMVAPGSLAEKAGVKAGDLILSINHRPVKDLAPGELTETIGGQEPLELEVRREGRMISLHIE